MGSTSFFSKVASIDPLAQALDLPGAHKYAQTIPNQVGPSSGPYTGVQATLAGANAGYAANGPGANGSPAAPNAPVGGGAGYGQIPGFMGKLNSWATGPGTVNPITQTAPNMASRLANGGSNPTVPAGGVPNYRGSTTTSAGW